MHQMRRYNESFICLSCHELYASLRYYELNMGASIHQMWRCANECVTWHTRVTNSLRHSYFIHITNFMSHSNGKVCRWMCDMTHSYQKLYASSICYWYHELYESFKYHELNMSLDSFVPRTLCVIEISRTQHGSIEVSNIHQMWRYNESFICHSHHELYASFEFHELNTGASNLEKTSIHHYTSHAKLW